MLSPHLLTISLFAARGEQAAGPVRIGYLSATSAPDVYMEIFRQGMSVLGYLEGRDFVIEARFAHRDYARFPGLVEELLSAKVDLIVMGGPASRAAPLAEKSVPVVFGFSGRKRSRPMPSSPKHTRSGRDAGPTAASESAHQRCCPLGRRGVAICVVPVPPLVSRRLRVASGEFSHSSWRPSAVSR
jgi:hypothetical protein